MAKRRKSLLPSLAVRWMCFGLFCFATTVCGSDLGGTFGPVEGGPDGSEGSVAASRAKTRYDGDRYAVELRRKTGRRPFTSGARDRTSDARTLPLFAPTSATRPGCGYVRNGPRSS